MRKDFGQVCYTAGCDNYASVSLKIPLGSRIQCVILVCDTCLPKYQLDDGNMIHQSHIAIKDDNRDAVKI
jgi:hypothetical protein